MTGWDALTWVSIAVLGPGVLVICVQVARDLRRLLGGAGQASADDAERARRDRR